MTLFSRGNKKKTQKLEKRETGAARESLFAAALVITERCDRRELDKIGKLQCYDENI